MITLNIHGIIDHCCGAKAPGDLPYTEKQRLLAAEFKKAKLPEIQPSSIQKWIERGQIPGDRLVQLIVLAEKQGKKLNLYKFVTTDKIKALFG